MNVILGNQATSKPGSDIYLSSTSRLQNYSVVFEDDGNTGYFYALDYTQKLENPIVGALFIYNKDQITDKDKDSLFQIGWSKDGRKAMLTINKYVHGVFNFDNKQGYYLASYPQKWSQKEIKKLFQ